MRAGAAKNYRENGAKNHWRRWVWNRIVERLSVPAREAVVVGLFGPESIDLEVAVSNEMKADGFDLLDPAESSSRTQIVLQCCHAIALNSYRSDAGTQVFDSVVIAPKHGLEIPSALMGDQGARDLRNSIAAIKAHAFGQRRHRRSMPTPCQTPKIALASDRNR